MTWDVALDLSRSLAAAAAVGALIALHPLKLFRGGRAAIDADIIRAQILVAVAGALMVLVVGESAARAFGLVGIGSFIRFRTVLKSARDTTVLLVLIGLGMACGLRQWPVVVVGTAFFFLSLFLIDLGRDENRRMKEPPMPLAEDGLL